MERILPIVLLLIFISTIVPSIQAQITFSEVMYDVATNEYHDEFVEIFNISYQDSVNILGWRFSDSEGIDRILPHRGGTKIGPRRFALILDGSYFENSMTYDSLLTDSVVILKIGDNSFGKNGLSNSVAERLTISDSTGQILTDYTYSIGNKPGFSDEKINLDERSDSLNWSDSKIEGGTPGIKNSVSPPIYDYGFKEHSFIFPVILIAHKPIVFSLELCQFGLKSILDSIDIIVYSDYNMDRSYQTDELLITQKKVPTIAQTILFEWDYPTAGEHQILAQLYFDKDELPENNYIFEKIRVFEEEISLHINEIKFLSENGEPEWIELVNLSRESIYLKDWALADLSDTTCIDSQMYLKQGEFIVLSEDTLPEFYGLKMKKMIILNKFPTLNDQEDEISLLNPAGSWIEKIIYDRQWLEGEEYRSPSLERINPGLYANKAENWGPCIHSNGATPGKQNSIYSKLTHWNSELRVSPNPFSPDQDGNDDVAIISGKIPVNSAKIKAEIYDIRGRLIRILKDNAFSGSHFDLVWDGKDLNGTNARIGIYIVYIQALNDRLGVLREMKTTVVLVHKL
jgi:hypothetical protein